jgi:anti-sigma factor RsiW
MDANGHEHYENELAAYMLGALEPHELGAFEAHLEDCERCQSRARWLGASVDVLPSAVEQVEPPPALRARLMETVRQEAPQEAPARAGTGRRRLADWLGSLTLRTTAPGRGRSLFREPRRRPRRPPRSSARATVGSCASRTSRSGRAASTRSGS